MAKKKNKKPKPRTMRVGVQVATQDDIDKLRQRFEAAGPPWSNFEYKLIKDRILIYSPFVPHDPKTGKPDPARRSMDKHLRINSDHPGPFRLEYWRHTEEWWPLPAFGTIEELAEYVLNDPLCTPME